MSNTVGITQVGELQEFIALCVKSCEAARKERQSWLTTVVWIFRLLSIDKFSIRELRAYTPQIRSSRARLPLLISKEASLKHLASLNPSLYVHTTDDKVQFYQHCLENQLPTPRLIFSAVEDDDQFRNWCSLPEEEAMDALPSDFILKDRQGAYSSGFRAVAKHGTGLIDAEGARLTISHLKVLLKSPGQN